MYRYYHLASFGHLAFDWNENHSLSGIHIELAGTTPQDSVQVIHDPKKIPHFINQLLGELLQYFEHGEPLKNIPWDQMEWGEVTEFQQSVLRAITAIPHGQTRTYAWVAMKIGKPKALRAVGQALRRNPFPIVVPCHRVVGADGALVGFMGVKEDPNKCGGGSDALSLKSLLIKTEHQYLNPVFSFLTHNNH